MKWELLKELVINRKPARLWKAVEHGVPHYSVTLWKGDMIREPRDYEASETKEEAIYMAKLRNKHD